MWRDSVAAFCERFDVDCPMLLAPMAGVHSPELSKAVIRGGGMGALGALLLQPAEIHAWADEVRRGSASRFQLNLWVPDPEPLRDSRHEADVRAFLSAWGPPVPDDAGNSRPPDFSAQCEALIDSRPAVISSVMGLFPPEIVRRAHSLGISWFAAVSTVDEAVRAEAAGADAIVAQGMEAGGHRASFDARRSETDMVGLVALVPAVVDAVRIPVIATGGVADARAVAAALTLGASAVQVGTGYLRTPEAAISPAWADAIGRTRPEDTTVSRVFSGRAGRSITTPYVRAATEPSAPAPAPYPVQRGLTARMRSEAAATNDIDRMQAWAGQAAHLARTEPADMLTRELWAQARALLP